MKLRKPTRISGFSLLEVCIGMAVIGIVCVALYSGMTAGMGTVRMARENERATQLMTEKLDTIRLYSWDKITTPGYIPATFFKAMEASGSLDNAVASGLVYTGTVTIARAPISTPYSTNLRIVTVKLDWSSGSMARTRSMTTLVAKDGMQNYIY